MIVRILPDDTVVVVNGIPQDQEDEFIANNPNGYKKVDSLPESRYGYYKWDTETGTIVVDEAKEIEAFKNELIQRANNATKDYILKYYPIEKQNADDQQKDYYGTAILMIRSSDPDATPITIDQIYLEVGKQANAILDGTSTLSDIVATYPETEQYYWEQLIKAGTRKAWVIRCVQVYNDYKNQVESATTLDELDALDIQMFDFPEFPTF